jgi:AsmA-like C-terminal region
MQIGRRVAKVLFWCLVFCLSVLGGGLWFAYTYVTDSTNAARSIRQYALRYLPTSEVDLGHVHVARLFGEVTLRNVRVCQPIRSLKFQALHIPWLNVLINTRKLLHGELDVREVDVLQPTLRLCLRPDGTWNLQGLLADPWPAPWLDKTPPIIIQKGTIELVCPEDETADPSGAPNAARKEPGGGSRIATILRDVSLQIKQEQVGHFLYRFEGSARGDILDRLQISGTVDLNTGRVSLEGGLAGLTLSESLRQRVPPKVRPAFKDLALNGGVVDLDRVRASYDPTAPPRSRLHYAVQARLRDGIWSCPRLPYRLNDLSAALEVEDGMLTLHRAEGYNGVTSLRARGRMRLGDPSREPLNLHLELADLELDDRLRSRTPPEYDDLWDLFKPSGLVGAEIDLARAEHGGPLELATKVTCHDVAATYRHFPYTLDHLRGSLILKKNTLTVNVQTISVGGRPLHIKGIINDPGPDAVVKLDVAAESVPIDETLLKALKPDVRKVVDQFKPSGTVKAHATVSRVPMAGRPEGLIAIDADIDLSERCEITWDKLPYTVRNLTGRLELHPDRWVFRDVHGRNGQAEILASGEVHKLSDFKLANGEDRLRVHVDLKARNLPFSEELRTALQNEWQSAWRTINPSGASDITARVDVDPDRGRDETHIVVDPRPESTVRLLVMRSPQPKHLDPGGLVELRMDDVRGRFVFDNGLVTMNDVRVQFRGAPVRFNDGTVRVEKTGRFDLNVSDLWIKGLRLDSELRKKMPPLMAQFAQRVDGQTFTARGDLRIGWSGIAGEPAWCSWDNVGVVLNDNRISTGIPLEHIQGELRRVKGWSNGLVVRVEGLVWLESVVLLGQQITRVESPFRVQSGVAELISLKGRFLGGDLWGRGRVTLDPTPSYWAEMSLSNARLEEYARTLGGRRAYRGDINARIECNGLGSDIHTLQGSGEAHINDGDLGELPAYFRPVALVTRTINKDVPRVRIKTAFDSVDLAFTISHGLWTLEPIKFTGNAFSLQGRGTLDPQSNLDLRLEPLLGRDRFHVWLLSDLSREASAPIVRVHVQGTLAHPDFSIEPLPLLQRDSARADRRADTAASLDP